MHRALSASLVAALGLFLGCAAPPETSSVQGVDALVGLDLPTAFERVAAEQGVPRELLLAIAWHNTSFAPPEHDEARSAEEGDAPEHRPAHGWLGLTDDQVLWAADLAGLDPDRVRSEPAANLWAGAALLAELAGPDADALLPGAAWWPAVTELAELPEAWMADEHAMDVFTTVQEGLDVTTDAGEHIAFEGRDLPDLEDIDVLEGPYEEDGDFSAVSGYPGRARYLPAHPSNYTHSRSSSIRRIVLHTTEGSYEGAIGWFRNPGADVSAHYVVRRSDGQVTQMVPDNLTAWHACSANSDTIGIEHEGHASQASTWTAANLDSSARLVGWLAARYGIPVDRDHIVGHGEVQPSYCAYRYDPGPHFPWASYMQKVKHYKTQGWQAADNRPKAKITVMTPKAGQQVGDPFVMQVKRKHAHHMSVYLGARRVKKDLRGNPTAFSINPSRPGWKRVQVRAYRADGSEAGRKTIRVRVRKSTVDVDPHARRIHRLDYALTSDLSSEAAYVRYWSNGGSVRDSITNRLRARPADDYRLIREFGSENKRLLVARAYRADGVLIGEGWRHITPRDRPGAPAQIDQMGADELVGTTMRLHAEAMPTVHRVEYQVDGAVVADFETGETLARPSDYELFVDFEEPGQHTVKARAFDVAGNLRQTITRTVHTPSWTLEVGWERTGPRTYLFDADAPAGTERVVFYRGSQLFQDVETGQGFAPGRAFRIEQQFPSTGPAEVTAIARDVVGNNLGQLTFYVDVQ